MQDMKISFKRKVRGIDHLCNQVWFKKAGWFYLPVHAMGIVVTLVMIIFLVAGCVALIRHDDAMTNNTFKIFIAASCAGFWWKWIADKTSGK